MQFGGQFERHKPAPAQLSLWQASCFVSLACWPGCLMQSLEHSIKGSTKVTKPGQVKTFQGGYLEHSIPDSLSYLSSGCLTYFQCFLGYQGPLWTTSYISPLHIIQADFASWCNLNLARDSKISLKDKVSEILFLWISWLMQWVGFGILLSHEADSAAATEIKTTFSPDRNLWLLPGFACPDKIT